MTAEDLDIFLKNLRTADGRRLTRTAQAQLVGLARRALFDALGGRHAPTGQTALVVELLKQLQTADPAAFNQRLDRAIDASNKK